ncbi:MAG TPA: histidine kinase dimerization/phosphoacceptor domain -containing protein [Candidatus Acidoferrales bacterium]|jgi:PAS domain S-box-containing protein|nr:histidine kinase dimerization/phosphoacceptor domain -containing protein [Candidatus Acidoferrales bacterium]
MIRRAGRSIAGSYIAGNDIVGRYLVAPGIPGAVLTLTGGASLLLGGLALAGWLFHFQGLTRLGPSFTPMAANTAAGLFLDGAALLCIAAGRPKAALGGAIWSLLAGVLTLAEYGFPVDLHVDELLVFVRAFPANPGRMPPNTAVCFVLCGLALFWASERRLRGKGSTAVGAIGVIVLALGTATVAPYLAGVRMHVWGNGTRMPADSGLGFMALGLGVVTLAWQYGGRDRCGWPRWLALAAGCLGFTISLCLGYTLGAEMQARTEFAARILWDYALETSADALRYEAASPLPFVVIGVGTLFSVVAVFIVELAFSSRRRAQAGEVANARLELEIDAHQRSEKALQAAYTELAAIYANAPVALLVVDEQFRLEKANDLASRFAEHGERGLVEHGLVGLGTGTAIECLQALADPRGCGYGPRCEECQIRLVALDSLRNGVKHEGVEAWVQVWANGGQELRCLLISSAAMEFGGRKALISVQDITPGKHAERELRESRARLTTALAEEEAAHSLLAAAFTAQPDAIFVYDAAGTLVLTNPAAADHLGTRAAGEVLPEVIERRHVAGGLSASPTQRALCGETVVNAEGPAGDRVLEMSSAPLLNAEANITGAVTVMHDITSRRRMEEALQATLRELESALAEKTVLLKEVHHRVKNNLAVICSLLSMKADATDIPDARQALVESQHRVRSIALIHEQLYGTDHLDRIDFARYTQELVAELNVACGTAQRGISVQVESEPIELEVNRAVPCALIVNELVTNALKHAFPGERSGEVRITFRRSDPGWLELAIGDNGVGCADGAGGSSAKSLGLRIVQILAKQLDGTIRQEPGEGSRFVVRFPEGSASTCETAPLSGDGKAPVATSPRT